MSLDKEGILNILEEFKKLKVLVVGDVILDRYIFQEYYLPQPSCLRCPP